MPEQNNTQKLEIVSSYTLSGDQPKAVDTLVDGLKSNKQDQVLLGVTGSGKTFSMAAIIERLQRPALIMAPNKTLAAQIYQEMKGFFPNNAVEYFVSYYDYYQPEAYIPKTGSYIEKDSAINEQIDLMRHSATRNLFERRDIIIVSSVSCIYGLGAPESYASMVLDLKVGEDISRDSVIKEFVRLQYDRNDFDFNRGDFRARGDIVDIFPSHLEDKAWRIEFFGDTIETITELDAITSKKLRVLKSIKVYANSHYITPQATLSQAVEQIKVDLRERLKFFYDQNQHAEAQRLHERTEFDLEMMVTAGNCKGIENYSRYLSGRRAGEPPPTLFEYLPKDALLFIDESHITVPQVGGMYNGDRARKSVLVEYGFRLPSAMDNRPLKFEEWEKLKPQTVYVSATPGKYELELVKGQVVEQIIRPTGLIDPVCEVRPASNQIDDLIGEVRKTIAAGYRVLATTLTKKMAEKLSEYFAELGIKASYLHSEVKTMERIEVISHLRQGKFDVLVGINLLREGLDIPECGLVAILDADKEGFLRSQSSLVQTIGRAARNVDGRVILYADKMTASMKYALHETERRRGIQLKYNEQHGIIPTSIKKNISALLGSVYEKDSVLVDIHQPQEFDSNEAVQKHINKLTKEMQSYAKNLEFEKATSLRNEIHRLRQLLMM